jgi:phosphohistidine phosphatase
VQPRTPLRTDRLALGRKYKIRPELAPDGTPEQLLEAALWPASRVPVVIVGHQPTLGATVAQLLAMQHGNLPGTQGRGLVDPQP